MKGLIPLVLCLLGTVAASSIERRDPQDDYSPSGDEDDAPDDKKYDDKNYDDRKFDDKWDKKHHWKPKAKDPHFFQVKVDDKCSWDWLSPKIKRDASPQLPNPPKLLNGGSNYDWCPLRNFALRLEKGVAIVTPYNKWWDPALPTFFVDDDTQLYTVSKYPLQLYIDGVTGALMYNKVGWLPPNAISTGFFHTGTNPLGKLHPSPSLLTWPTTPGLAFSGDWTLCKIGGTGQWQVFANGGNFVSQGLILDKYECSDELLAAVNANPWKKKGGKHWGGPGGGGW